MKNLNAYVSIYKEQLKKGDILIAYKELVSYVLSLRKNAIKKLSGEYTFSGMHHGYMDYTYFYYSNDFLKSKKLKLGLVLNHLEMRFEVWLLGNTISIQRHFWELMKTSKWNRNKMEKPKYSILEATLIEKPDFNNLDLLSNQIESKMKLVSDEILASLRSIN